MEHNVPEGRETEDKGQNKKPQRVWERVPSVASGWNRLFQTREECITSQRRRLMGGAAFKLQESSSIRLLREKVLSIEGERTIMWGKMLPESSGRGKLRPCGSSVIHPPGPSCFRRSHDAKLCEGVEWWGLSTPPRSVWTGGSFRTALGTVHQRRDTKSYDPQLHTSAPPAQHHTCFR